MLSSALRSAGSLISRFASTASARLGLPRVRWQNLNDRHEGGRGPGWRHGRAWWDSRDESRGGGRYQGTLVATAEWSVWHGSKRLGLTVTLPGTDGEGRFGTVYIGLGFAGAYLGADVWPLNRTAEGEGRVYGLTYSCGDDWLSWQWGNNRFGDWEKGQPWWRSQHAHGADLLFGRASYQSTEYHSADVLIPMPEASYPGTVKLTKDVWRRKRWPWWPLTLTLYRAKVDIPLGVPAPSKWDDDDATFGLSTLASTVEEAVGKLVANVYRDRKRHGGQHWMPTADVIVKRDGRRPEVLL